MNFNKIKTVFTNQYFLIGLITIFALFLRLLNIDKPTGLWHDELITYYFSSKSFPFGILRALWREDFHMPLYYMYLHIWMKFFGTEDIILRLSSVFWGVLAIPAFYFLGKTYESKKLGYLLSMLGCMNPVMIYYSQEFRFYSMLLFLSTLSIIFFLKLLDKPDNKFFLLFGITNLVILYIYTLGIIFIGLETILLLIHIYLNKRKYFINYLRFYAIFFILTVPYLMFLTNIVISLDEVFFPLFGWMEPPRLDIAILSINNLFSPLILCIHNSFDVNDVISKLHFNPIILTCLLLLPSIIFIIGFIKQLTEFDKKQLYLIIITFSFIAFNLYMYFKGDLALSTRYLIAILPLILLLCSKGLLSIQIKYLKYMLIISIFSIYFINIFNYKVMPAFGFRSDDIKSIVNKLGKLSCDDNDYILFPDSPVESLKYSIKCKIIPFSRSRIETQDKTKQETLKMFNKDLVAITNKYSAPETLMPYFKSTQPTLELTNFINSEVAKIPKGNNLIFVDHVKGRFPPSNVHNYFNVYKGTEKDLTYYKQHIFYVFEARLYEDLFNILNANKDLKKINEITIYGVDKSLQWHIVIYKKYH